MEEAKKFYSEQLEKEISVPVLTCLCCQKRFDDEIEARLASEEASIDEYIEPNYYGDGFKYCFPIRCQQCENE